MKKFKKAMALSLALAMGLSLVACGDKEKETTTEATTTEATTTEAAATDDDVALYFLNSESIVPVEDLGITADMYSNAYQYTVDYATIDGKLKGMCWQATPGCFIYRTDIAEEVLGSSDPAKVQEYVKAFRSFRC